MFSKKYFSGDDEPLKKRDKDTRCLPSHSITPLLSRAVGKKIRLSPFSSPLLREQSCTIPQTSFGCAVVLEYLSAARWSPASFFQLLSEGS